MLRMADLVVGGGKTVMAVPQFDFDGQTVADGQPDGGWRQNGDGSPMVTPYVRFQWSDG